MLTSINPWLLDPFLVVVVAEYSVVVEDPFIFKIIGTDMPPLQ